MVCFWLLFFWAGGGDTFVGVFLLLLRFFFWWGGHIFGAFPTPPAEIQFGGSNLKDEPPSWFSAGTGWLPESLAHGPLPPARVSFARRAASPAKAASCTPGVRLSPAESRLRCHGTWQEVASRGTFFLFCVFSQVPSQVLSLRERVGDWSFLEARYPSVFCLFWVPSCWMWSPPLSRFGGVPNFKTSPFPCVVALNHRPLVANLK